ncbi:hypothetical protein LCGC14_0909910 [marine sediment metagenome]|uniref:Uncharacterized protein n=1 Tax=marine sediment metagenome TaxID=412755 RepID=A0A0F9S0R5_9ZZZZ
MTTQTRTLGVGEPVLRNGEMHLVTDMVKRFSQEDGTPFMLVVYENTAHKVTALASDQRWDDELGCWYSWGVVISKADRAIVAELRDRGLLPCRKTRTPGNPPAGGEHLNLFKALFHLKPAQFWNAAMAEVRKGGDLPVEAQAAVAAYTERYKQPLSEGYADPDADDSVGE